MAFTAMNASATGLNLLSTSLEVIANNMANTNTDGFKSSRVNFKDLLCATERRSRVLKMTSATSHRPGSTSASAPASRDRSLISSRGQQSTRSSRSTSPSTVKASSWSRSRTPGRMDSPTHGRATSP